MIRQVVILCGGLATRLGKITDNMAKSMIPVNGKPFISYQLQLLKKYNVDNVILCTSHLEWQIRDYVQNGSKWGLKVKYVYDSEQLGTGGALKKAESYLFSNFIVWYGDSYCDYDLNRINCDNTNKVIIYKNRNRYDTSKIEIDKEFKVSKYDKNGCGEYIDVFYCFNNTILKLLSDKSDISAAMQKLIKKNQLYAYEVPVRFYQVGDIKGYNEFKRLMGERPNGNTKVFT